MTEPSQPTNDAPRDDLDDDMDASDLDDQCGPLNPEIQKVVDEIRGVYQHNIDGLDKQVGNLVVEDLVWFHAGIASLDERDRKAIMFLLVDRIRYVLIPLKAAAKHLAADRE